MTDQRWLRIIPVATVMYAIAFINRTNVSIALPSMSRDLHMNPLQAGAIASAFFWGYLLLQIPGGYLASHWEHEMVREHSAGGMGNLRRGMRTGAHLATVVGHAFVLRGRGRWNVSRDLDSPFPLVSTKRAGSRQRVVFPGASDFPGDFLAGFRLAH